MNAADPRLFADRLIVLDTETTGLDPRTGDRVVEIGAIELVRCLPSGREYHVYLNPGRAMPEGAQRVHGLTDAFLADKPRFAEVARDFLAFLGDCAVIAHNAAFDMGFLDAELARCGHKPLGIERAICTLQLARSRYPGASHSLDALCDRFSVDRTVRSKHGALIDTRLLAHVYLELIGGRQIGLGLGEVAPVTGAAIAFAPTAPAALRAQRTIVPHAPTADEEARHAAFLQRIADPIWLKP